MLADAERRFNVPMPEAFLHAPKRLLPYLVTSRSFSRPKIKSAHLMEYERQLLALTEAEVDAIVDHGPVPQPVHDRIATSLAVPVMEVTQTLQRFAFWCHEKHTFVNLDDQP